MLFPSSQSDEHEEESVAKERDQLIAAQNTGRPVRGIRICGLSKTYV
jgi:hypothetical protein